MITEHPYAFVFPGQGSQKVGMSNHLIGHKNPEISRIARLAYKEADDTLQMNLAALCAEGPKERLDETRFTQPALLVTSIAALRILNYHGLAPDFVAGHSLGEYSALVAAESLSFEQALKLVQARGEFMTSAGEQNPGSMVAVVGLNYEEVEAICMATGAEIANVNTQSQIVISGKRDSVEYATEQVKDRKGKAIGLKVSIAGHSSLMELASQNLQILLQSQSVLNPKVRFIQNSTGRYTPTGEQVKRGLVDQMTGTVRWLDTVNLMAKDGVEEFIEVGPGQVLSNIINKINPHASVGNSDRLITNFS